MRAFLSRSEHDSSILYVRVQRIAWANIEAAAKRTWKNDLSLGGNLGLHGKTILLQCASLGNRMIGADLARWLNLRWARRRLSLRAIADRRCSFTGTDGSADQGATECRRFQRRAATFSRLPPQFGVLAVCKELKRAARADRFTNSGI